MEHPIQSLVRLLTLLDLVNPDRYWAEIHAIENVASLIMSKLRETLQHECDLRHWQGIFNDVSQLVKIVRSASGKGDETLSEILESAMELFEQVREVIAVGTSQDAEANLSTEENIDETIPSRVIADESNIGEHPVENRSLTIEAPIREPVKKPVEKRQEDNAQIQKTADPEVEEKDRALPNSELQSNDTDFREEIRAELERLHTRLEGTERRCLELEKQIEFLKTPELTQNKPNLSLPQTESDLACAQVETTHSSIREPRVEREARSRPSEPETSGVYQLPESQPSSASSGCVEHGGMHDDKHDKLEIASKVLSQQTGPLFVDHELHAHATALEMEPLEEKADATLDFYFK